MAKNILLTGASGMIGGLILEQCLQNDKVAKIISLVRRSSGRSHPKLQEVIIEDFLALDKHQAHFQSIDVAHFCIGAYTGSVSAEVLKKITVDIPLAFAKCLQTNSPQATFCLLSGQGADRTEKSRTNFAKYKGMVENGISEMGFKFHTFRPGYIYPVEPRKEPNFAYSAMRTLYPLIKMFGKNASIKSTELAQVMFLVGMDEGNKTEVFENRDMIALLGT